jgi:Collagen triple helix repeat (20 copies)
MHISNKLRSLPALVIASAALFIALSGGAYAAYTGTTSGSRIQNHSIGLYKLTHRAITRLHGANGTNGTNGLDGARGPQGATGPKGDKGDKGDTGAPGDSYLHGAYYSVANYDVGDTNGGAVATVACKLPTDTAISGGVQTLQLGSNGLGNNVPVSSSFPGRMDWSTNTPKSGRLDGWIVQFGGNSSSTDLGSPQYVKVWALCVPGLNVPVDQTYTESGS